eukprot:scaffold7086_cov120-Isochrysis_galbana.AAC.2
MWPRDPIARGRGACFKRVGGRGDGRQVRRCRSCGLEGNVWGADHTFYSKGKVVVYQFRLSRRSPAPPAGSHRAAR